MYIKWGNKVVKLHKKSIKTYFWQRCDKQNGYVQIAIIEYTHAQPMMYQSGTFRDICAEMLLVIVTHGPICTWDLEKNSNDSH